MTPPAHIRNVLEDELAGLNVVPLASYKVRTLISAWSGERRSPLFARPEFWGGVAASCEC
jgi:hypothetical protein